MKDKIFMLIVGILIGAIITSAGFLMFGKKGGKRDFDPSKMRDGNFTPPSGFSKDSNDTDSRSIDPNNIPEKPDGSSSERPSENGSTTTTETNADPNNQST